MAQSIRRQQNDLRHERDRLQTLLENINAAVVVLDGARQVTATNATARKLFHDGLEPVVHLDRLPAAYDVRRRHNYVYARRRWHRNERARRLLV